MGLASWLGFDVKPLPDSESLVAPIMNTVLETVLNQSVEQLWREQPHLRTVVGFMARNIAQLGLHVFEFDGDDGRTRKRDSPTALLLRKPNAQTTGYELIESLVSDLALYDNAFWYVAQDVESDSGWVIRHIPRPWVTGTYGTGAFEVEGYKVLIPGRAGEPLKIPAVEMLVFHGWNPTDPKLGTSPVQALKAILAEQIHAQVYRDQTWTRGGRVGTYLSRPTGAPEWSPEARTKFARQWRDAYAGDKGSKAGGEPLLEDGMELKKVGFSAKDEQYIEASKLALSTVAQVYHVNPTMVGLLDNANYSNVREFRRMLYGDTLGPLLEMIQQRINTFLVPRIEPGLVYAEFNIQSKLAGSFEEQSAVMQTAVGGPWMSINEARAKQNLPSIEGGDEVLRNLNQTTTNPEPAPDDPDTE